MVDYENYQLSEWNRRLFSHYFARASHEQPAVTSLLVTSAELTRAVRAQSSDSGRVRNAFVACIRSGMVGRLFPAKFDYYENWVREQWAIQGVWASTPPDFVAHLIFSCLAATESPEDPADEKSFIARLDALCGLSVTDIDLRLMPALWRYLSEWLSQADGSTYRGLVLPPDNGWTRIGYTVRLAFPSLPDQQALVDVVQELGYMGQEPPVPPVLFAVGNARDRFRKRFQGEFLDFRAKYLSDVSDGSSLREHPFWASVCDAASGDIDSQLDLTHITEVQILAETDYDRFVPFAVVKEVPPLELGFQVEALSRSLGTYKWVLLSKPTEGVESAPEHAVGEILERRKRLPTLDSLVQQGVLLFAEFEADVFELVSDASARSVKHALVRNDLVHEFAQRFSKQSTIRVTDPVIRWTAFLDVAVSPAAPGTLDGTALKSVWALHAGLPITRLTVVGGIRIEGAWLGSKESLPSIGSHGDGDLWVHKADDVQEALTRSSDGLWRLPAADYEGAVNLVQRYADQDVDRRHLEFVAAPSMENFKPPSTPETLLLEAAGHSTSLSESSCAGTEDKSDWGSLADRLLLLGPNVGQFVIDESKAAWQAVRFAKLNRIRRGVIRGEASLPRARVPLDELRRRWRKVMFNSSPDPMDPDTIAARSNVRRAAFNEQLPFEDPQLGLSKFSTAIVSISPDKRVERLVTILVARLNARKGVSLQHWYELLREVTSIGDRTILRSITRGWEEAGLIDVVTSSRWRSYMVYAKLPALASFRCGNGWGATLGGLSLASTVRGLRRLADQEGLVFEERSGFSEWVPSTLCFRAATREALSRLATDAGVAYLPVSFRAVEELASSGRSLATAPPPVNYVERNPVSIFLGDEDYPPGIQVFRWYRRDSPDYWEVVGNSARYWTYDVNSARLWTSFLSGVTPLTAEQDGIVAERSFLPLALARFLSAVSGLRSGPHAANPSKHTYPVHAAETGIWVMKRLNEMLPVPESLSAFPLQ